MVRSVQVSVANVAAVRGPEYGIVRLCVYLGAQRGYKRVGGGEAETAGVAVSHREIDLRDQTVARVKLAEHCWNGPHLAAVTPHLGGMERQGGGQDPQFRQDAVHPVPGVHIQQTQPELAPGGDGDRPAPGEEQLPRSARVGIRSGDS